MAVKRLWSSLAKSTRDRYTRNGVTARMYNSPRLRNENKDLFAKARGHAPESYAVQRAREFGVEQALPSFKKLSRKQQQEIADGYMQGLLQKNTPIRPTGHGGFEFAPAAPDQGTPAEQKHGTKIAAFDETVMKRFRLEELLDQLGKKGFLSTEDWETFRQLYNSHF